MRLVRLEAPIGVIHVNPDHIVALECVDPGATEPKTIVWFSDGDHIMIRGHPTGIAGMLQD